MLELRIKTYKRKLDRDLRHIKLILAHERRNMPVAEWLKLVDDTKQSIIDNPQDFLPGGVPPGLLFHAAIEKVFDGFLEDQRLLALQTSPGFKISRKGHS